MILGIFIQRISNSGYSFRGALSALIVDLFLAGVARLDPNWLLLARNLSATSGEIMLHMALPRITGEIRI